MKIQYPASNIYFGAKNPEIRFADDIVRKVNKEFPRISNTLLEDLNHSDILKYSLLSLYSKLYVLREKKYQGFSRANKEKSVKATINSIRDLKCGNCQESAYLSAIGAKINGLKNVKFAYLVSPKNYDYDHAVIVVSKNKKPYILDSWLGFADYFPNAVKRWQKEFAHHFDFKKADSQEIVLKRETSEFESLLENIDPNILRKLYPELIIPKKKNF